MSHMTHDDDRDGGHEAVTTIRESLKRAVNPRSATREMHLKNALGEVVTLRARRDVSGGADLEEQLKNALVAERDEAGYHIRQALSLLGGVASSLEERSAVNEGARGPGASEVPTAPDEIRAAFEAAEIPEKPAPIGGDERDVARVRWPDAVIDETAPTMSYQAAASVTITAPTWALATAAFRLQAAYDSGKVDDVDDAEYYVRDFLNDCVFTDVTWRTPGGADAVDAILEAVEVPGSGDTINTPQCDCGGVVDDSRE